MEFTLPLPDFHDESSAAYKHWQLMKQRFRDQILLKPKNKNHFKSAGASLLMFINGDKIRDVMKSFSADPSHKIDNLSEAFEKIEDTCMPIFILLYERYKFFSFRQKRFEDLRKFVSELQMLAGFCELQEHQQKHVADRIVDGVYSESLRKTLKSISDVELDTVLEICERAQGDGINKPLDDLCTEISGQTGTGRRKSHTENRTGGIVNEKNSRDKCNVSGKKSRVGEKKGRQNSKVASGQLQETIQTRPRSSRSTTRTTRARTTRAASFRSTLHCREPPAVTATSPASFPTPALRKSSLTNRTKSVKTLRKRHMKQSGAESFGSEPVSESVAVTTEDVLISFKPHASSCTPRKRIFTKSKQRTEHRKHDNFDSDSLDDGDDEADSRSTVKESQLIEKDEVGIKYSHINDLMDLKLEPEIPLPCQQSTGDNSENKHTRKMRKCAVYRRESSTSCEFQHQSRGSLVQREDKCGVCDINFTSSDSRSQHMKRTHPDIFTFHCGECDMLFGCQNDLDQHRSSHSMEDKITCRDCGAVMNSSREYNQHRRKQHKNIGCDCDQCGLSFPFPSKLRLHLMSKHNATKPYMCEICGSSFAEKNMLTTHKNIHSGEKKYECPTCGRRFLLKTTLNNHRQTHLDRRPHTCSICGMGFKLSYYLKSHMKTHSENRERPHICSKCGAAFLKLAQLKNHERKHTGEKPYRCPVCSTAFSQLSSMKKHIKHIHEGVKPMDRFSCEYCGLSFTHSCKLQLHLMKHTGERPFACNFCGCTYREKHQLTRHMKTHSGSEPFQCPFCSRRFLQKSSLEGHVRKHTGEKPFQCPVCFQSFSHKGYLRDHIKVHDDNRERKYKCSVCDKAFTCSSHMRSHEKLHSGDKPHKCDICGSRFTKRSSVKKHLKRTHGIQDVPALQAHNSDIVADTSQEVPAGMTLTHMQAVGVNDQAEQQTGTQPGIQHPVQTHTDTQTDLQTDRPVELRAIECTAMTLQIHSELQLSHMHPVIRPEALPDIQPQPQHGMCPGLHTVHSSLQHHIHQHPSIQIVHPGLHTAVHLHPDSRVLPCITPVMNASMQQTEHIQEMLVYTLTT
ncbi:hypothetical protein BsWGS_26367 [Bradybaena similaris]